MDEVFRRQYRTIALSYLSLIWGHKPIIKSRIHKGKKIVPLESIFINEKVPPRIGKDKPRSGKRYSTNKNWYPEYVKNS